jgi:hypothetical protein
MIEVTWTFFKSFLTSTAGKFVYIEEPSANYSAYIAYQGLTIKCFIGPLEKAEFEASYKALGNTSLAQLSNIQSIPSFTAKTVTINNTTKKLFARNTGFQHAMSVGANTVTYTLTYPWCKILGVEVIGAETLDYCDLEVYDTAAGTYSGVPNYKLNQFAYSVNIPMDYYIRLSQFDADIYQGMVIKITYNSVSAKTVGFNIIMNELKD